MSPLIILCLIVAVAFLLNRSARQQKSLNDLSYKADDLRHRADTLERRLGEMEKEQAPEDETERVAFLPAGAGTAAAKQTAAPAAELPASEILPFEPPPIPVMGEPLEPVPLAVVPAACIPSSSVPPPLPSVLLPEPVLAEVLVAPSPVEVTPVAVTTEPAWMTSILTVVGIQEAKPASSAPPALTPPPLSAELAAKLAAPASSTVPPALPRTVVPAPAPPEKASFEMRLGTYWLVRLGIVMLLTGLVFLGTYAYNNWVGKLGAGGKVALLYLASGALLGAGTWLFQREKKEAMKNYAQVLFAGGLAAVYFTTYAAHWLPDLRVIASPLVDGALLLAWAGYIVWLADRRRSEVLALFAIGLAYYTSCITNVGLFTLYSNLVLTTAAVFFLVRNRWATLSVASLVATYTSFAFWRFYHHGAPGALGESELWLGNGFLSAYWVLFTAAAFFSRSEQLTGVKRAAFASMNNGAFFALVLSSMWAVHHGNFWKFSLAFGTAQLVLAALVHRCLAAEPAVRNAYLTQGVLLVTVGFIAKFTGLNLALVLAAESVVLLGLGRQQGSVILRGGALVAALLSVCWAVADQRTFHRAGLLTGAAVGAMLLFNAWWANRGAEPDAKESDASPVFFTVLALVVWVVTTSRNCVPEWRGLVFAVESAAFLLASGPLKLPSLAHGAYPFALFATGWVLWSVKHADTPGLLNGVGTGALLLANSFVSDGRRPVAGGAALSLRSIFFTALALVAWLWTTWQNTDTEFRALLLAIESMAFLVAGSHLGNLPLVVGGRVFGGLSLLAAHVLFTTHADAHALVGVAFAWPHALAGALLLGNAIIERRARALADDAPDVAVAGFSVLALLLWMETTWCCAPGDWRAPLLAGEALLFTASLPVLRLTELALFGQSFLLLAQANCAWLLLESHLLPWWNPAVVIVATLAHGHWWQRAQTHPWLAGARQLFLGAYALAATALLYLWLHPQFSAPHWLAFASLLAVGLTAYAAVTRAWFLAIGAQFFLLASIVEFLRQLYVVTAAKRPEWFFPLAPIVALTALSFATLAGLARAGLTKTPLGEQLTLLARAYRIVAVGLALLWTFRYVPDADRFWFLALLGAGFFAVSGWRQSREALVMSAAFTGMGFAVFLTELGGPGMAYWANLPAILLLLAQQRVARLFPERYSLPLGVHTAAIIIGGCGVWLFLSSWVTLKAGGFGFFLTASWAVLALGIFAVGFACRERVYRWHGLAVLACAMGRVVLFDVWKLETIYRILSFMALGVVLLVLGFIYNKYQEQIKEWL